MSISKKGAKTACFFFVFCMILNACGTYSGSPVVVTKLVTKVVIRTVTPTIKPTSKLTLTPSPMRTSTTVTGCTTNSQTIYAGPGVQYEVVGGFVKGDCGTLTARNQDTSWVLIVSNKTPGWVNLSYLAVNQEPRVLPIKQINSLPSEPSTSFISTSIPSTSAIGTNCDPSYPDVCLQDGIGDWDCARGSGNGPNYIAGPIRVFPPDPFELDRDGDG